MSILSGYLNEIRDYWDNLEWEEREKFHRKLGIRRSPDACEWMFQNWCAVDGNVKFRLIPLIEEQIKGANVQTMRSTEVEKTDNALGR